MDELDLVRLARPSAPALDDERLAAIKSRSFTFADADIEAAGDAPPTGVVPVVELSDDLAAGRSSRRPVLWLAAAASIVVIVGGLALVARNRSASTSLTDGTSGLDVWTSASATSEPVVPTMEQLDGKTYDVVRIVVNGVERNVVGAASVGVYTTVRAMVVFFVGTECNGGGGEARIEGGHLVIAFGSRTRGCRDDLMQQDDALAQIVTSQPLIARQGDVLTLTSGASVIEARLQSGNADVTSPISSVTTTGRPTEASTESPASGGHAPVVSVSPTSNTFDTVARPACCPVVVGPPAPQLGSLTSADELIAALLASEPLDNLTAAAVAQHRSPAQSICIDILANREPAAGTVVHEAYATYGGEAGVVLVVQRTDGTRHVRAYSTGEPDETGGCRLLARFELP